MDEPFLLEKMGLLLFANCPAVHIALNGSVAILYSSNLYDEYFVNWYNVDELRCTVIC